MTIRWLTVLSLACFLTPLGAESVNDGDDPECPRHLEAAGNEWSDATFASVAGRGIATMFKTGHTIAQVWRLGPRTAYVIARLKLLDPAMDEAGLVVSVHVKDGRFLQLNELDPRICFGLTREGEVDFSAIKNLDRSVRGRVTDLLREQDGIERTAIEVTVGPKTVVGEDLKIVARAVYLHEGRPVRRNVAVELSRAKGFRAHWLP